MSELRFRFAVRVLALVSCALLAGPAAAQVVDDVYPLEPADGARVGARPIFRVGVDGNDLLKMKFKIVLSQDDFETEAYVLDQIENKNGWAFTGLAGMGEDEPGAIHRTRQSLADGVYDWKVYAWNGLEWIEGDRVFRVQIDNTPPADVEGFRIGKDSRGRIVLEWPPVTIDKNGQPEYVQRYHIYRYKNARVYNYMRAFEIGTSEDTSFVDTTEDSTPLVFYKIKAEDDAGNHERHKWRRADPPADESGE